MVAEEKHRPLLSICLAGRDDNYMSDFKYRISTALEHYARSLQAISRSEQVEILVVDWGSEVPLSTSLRLSPQAHRLCKFLYVPKKVIERTQAERGSYDTARSCNVALRRASGKYVFVTSADQLMPCTAVEALVRLLGHELHTPIEADRLLMLVPRVQVPWQYVKRKPSLEDWDRYMFVNEYALIREPSPVYRHQFASTAGFVFSREISEKTRGLSETLTGWGWNDMEFCFRATLRMNYVYLSSLGILMFHMGHPPQEGTRPTRRIASQPVWSASSYVNDSEWGLGSDPIGRQQAIERQSSVRADSEPDEAVILEEVAGQITGKQVSDQVVSTVRRLHSEGEECSLRPSTLSMLSWYSRKRFPRTFLQVGTLDVDACTVVAAACPSSQMCVIQVMSGEFPGHQLTRLVTALADIGHSGHFQLVNGDLEHASETLEYLRPTFPDFDLMHVRASSQILQKTGIIRQLLGSLSEGGALVLECDGEAFTVAEIDHVAGMQERGGLYVAEEKDAIMILRPKARATAFSNQEHSNPAIYVVPHTSQELMARPSLKRKLARRVWRKLNSLRDKYGETL